MALKMTEIPYKSLLRTNDIAYDYIDSFQGSFQDKFQNIGITEVGKLFFSSAPNWIDKLFAFRNKLVGFLGLKTSEKLTDRQKILENLKFEKGDQIGLFKVFNKTEDEIILGEDDKHLNFRVSLYLDKQNEDKTDKNLIITTTVKFNNWFGRLYFLPVKPFHKLIVPTMLKAIINKLEKQQL